MPGRRRRHPLVTPWTVAGAVTALAIAVALAVTVADDTSVTSTRTAATPTGEQNAMGMPVIETPGRATGVARVASVAVSGAHWELGRVPLDTAVRPTWTLRNTGTEAVTIGEPHPEVREGCCPGPFTIENRTIAPGGETTMTFELSMHAGMDGWHDIAVHVPVTTAGAEELLELGVTGDFRGR